MISDDLAERLLVVAHVQNPNRQLKVDLVRSERQNEALDIGRQRLEMGSFDSHIAQ